jgi:hypothetical protein
VYNMDSLGSTLRDSHRVLCTTCFNSIICFMKTRILLIPHRVGWAQHVRVTLKLGFYSDRFTLA